VNPVSVPTRAQIDAAAAAIAPHVRHTPVIEIPGDTLGIDATLVFKLEYLQVTGAFKARGGVTRNLDHRGVADVRRDGRGSRIDLASGRYVDVIHTPSVACLDGWRRVTAWFASVARGE